MTNLASTISCSTNPVALRQVLNPKLYLEDCPGNLCTIIYTKVSTPCMCQSLSEHCAFVKKYTLTMKFQSVLILSARPSRNRARYTDEQMNMVTDTNITHPCNNGTDTFVDATNIHTNPPNTQCLKKRKKKKKFLNSEASKIVQHNWCVQT